jgi:hypothetical protein
MYCVELYGNEFLHVAAQSLRQINYLFRLSMAFTVTRMHEAWRSRHEGLLRTSTLSPPALRRAVHALEVLYGGLAKPMSRADFFQGILAARAVGVSPLAWFGSAAFHVGDGPGLAAAAAELQHAEVLFEAGASP